MDHPIYIFPESLFLFILVFLALQDLINSSVILSHLFIVNEGMGLEALSIEGTIIERPLGNLLREHSCGVLPKCISG